MILLSAVYSDFQFSFFNEIIWFFCVLLCFLRGLCDFLILEIGKM